MHPVDQLLRLVCPGDLLGGVGLELFEDRYVGFFAGACSGEGGAESGVGAFERGEGAEVAAGGAGLGGEAGALAGGEGGEGGDAVVGVGRLGCGVGAVVGGGVERLVSDGGDGRDYVRVGRLGGAASGGRALVDGGVKGGGFVGGGVMGTSFFGAGVLDGGVGRRLCLAVPETRFVLRRRIAGVEESVVGEETKWLTGFHRVVLSRDDDLAEFAVLIVGAVVKDCATQDLGDVLSCIGSALAICYVGRAFAIRNWMV